MPRGNVRGCHWNKSLIASIIDSMNPTNAIPHQRNTVTTALDDLVERYLEACHQLTGTLPRMEHDPEWPSPCYQGDADSNGMICWQPVRQTTTSDLFEGLACALDTPIHPDLIAYYSHLWSDPIPVSCQEGELSLLFIWNDADYERLRANLIGHALTKRKLRLPLTLFFACTEPDANYFLSLDNDSGEVLLEQPGRKPLRTIAPSLAEFLGTLQPNPK